MVKILDIFLFCSKSTSQLGYKYVSIVTTHVETHVGGQKHKASNCSIWLLVSPDTSSLRL